MENFNLQNGWFVFGLVIFLLWTIPWKGMALWKAARRGEIDWFVVLLIFNTLSILEILYLFVFSKDKNDKEEIESEEQFQQEEQLFEYEKTFPDDASNSQPQKTVMKIM